MTHPAPAPAAARAEHTPEPWTCNLARMRDDAPVFGFFITAVGKTPYVASAGVAAPHHALIVHRDFRNLVSTGFTEEEVVANGRLLAAAPDLRLALAGRIRVAVCQGANVPAEFIDWAAGVVAESNRATPDVTRDVIEKLGGGQ